MRSRILLVGLMVVAAACSDSVGGTTTAGPVTNAPPVTTTAPPAPTTPGTSTPPTTAAPTGLDVSAQPWVAHTPNGIEDADGATLFDSDPILGSTNLVRDHAGGLIFTDTFGLWWWQAGDPTPALVLDGSFVRIIEAIPTAGGPVVRIAGDPDRYVDLTNLQEVQPLEGAVEITEDFQEIRRVDGLSVRVTQPDVTLTSEGFPDEVLEPAHLVVQRDGDTVLDLRVGGPAEAYARVHDFDGQRIIVSRGPFEPALPRETFIVIDLACPECVQTFTGGATTAALVGPDVEWDGDVAPPADICTTWDPAFTAASPIGLPVPVERGRASLLRAAAACDVTALSYRLGADPDIVLGHTAIDLLDPWSWLETSPNLFAEIAAALELPAREVTEGDDTAFVFPAWFAVDAWEELSAAEQAAMTERYGPDADQFWADYFAVAVEGDLAVTLTADGQIDALTRPLS